MGLKTIVFIFSQVMLSVGFAANCDIQIDKTMWPVDGTIYHSHLCVEDYFQAINIGTYSQNEDTGKLTKYSPSIQYYDMFLFQMGNPAPLGNEGRLALVKQIYTAAFNSLRSEEDTCELQIFNGNQPLSITDFKYYARSQAGQPGSRLMLTFEDVQAPNWKMLCTNKAGETVVKKSGDYFFIFVDVYENLGGTGLKDHLVQYLFSLR